MSFNTSHNLTWETDSPTRDEFIELVGPMMLDKPAGQALCDNEYENVNDVISGIEVAKWYDSDHHIAVCSQNWPEVIFTLRWRRRRALGHVLPRRPCPNHPTGTT